MVLGTFFVDNIFSEDTMKKFMDKDFLLETKCAKRLYHGAAAAMPVFDYHCHLSPQEIAGNKKFDNLSEVWLGGDHYKWRMMRAMGIDEACVTGSAPPRDKFLAWARTIENLIGNPLYHWTHLELQRYFNISETLTGHSAPRIWEAANAKLQSDELSVKGIFNKFNIYAVGTTDDPADTLEYHRAIAAGNAKIGKIATKVIPTFRPDNALYINLKGFDEYISKLSAASGVNIKNVDDVINALENRLDFFVEVGCRASDHAFEAPPFALASDAEINAALAEALAGKPVTGEIAEAYQTKVLCALAGFYAKRDIAMQLHLAVIRSVNVPMLEKLGPNVGGDAAHDLNLCTKLSALLSRMEAGAPSSGGLPKTILYTLNPKDYYPIATIMGGFQGNAMPGKMQLGSAWWFCDHRDGMEEQIKVLANLGVLPAFVGMLTDSRSFLSYPRHEYFRRILCNVIGKWVENGEYPADYAKLEGFVRDVSFLNAERYFG
jgi:glucuronate isomerase